MTWCHNEISFSCYSRSISSLDHFHEMLSHLFCNNAFKLRDQLIKSNDVDSERTTTLLSENIKNMENILIKNESRLLQEKDCSLFVITIHCI